MWVTLRAETGKYLYIVICYFPSSTSLYASPRGQSPSAILDNDLWEFSKDGDIIILGDFNATRQYFMTLQKRCLGSWTSQRWVYPDYHKMRNTLNMADTC
ncbi:hypothetical protein GOP47_0023137 [Adiantum capillus-veneris]|uniref:Endonuclease/exonuclease/phosphatase domain-containing protein n=1 Tax=Adiantum capillus-veneris TaxID=13818 RepID=A0A9D4U7U0_ADICA|nr:hypothetical protein GOP47_0023137 [Adiantum capillus-veneris]